jgi:Ca2+-binding RTX toxin-like protein
MSSKATAGSQTLVNTFTSGNQSGSSIAALADGGWVVTWESVFQDGDSYGVYQQRYDAAGAKVGVETRVNSTTAASQYASSVTGLSDGGWVVTWNSLFQDGSGGGAYQQHYDSNGGTVGVETRVNTTTAGDQFGKSIVGLADGGWIVTWQSVDQDGSVYQQRYRADGTPVASEVRINTTTLNSQIEPSVTALADGGWVSTWTSYDQDGDATGIYQQRYAAFGAKVGSETLVNTETGGDQFHSSVASLSDGGWVVIWVSVGQDGDRGSIYQQRYESTGDKAGIETLVNTTTQDNQLDPSIVGLADGGWIVTWVSSGQDGDGDGVYQQRYDAGGVRLGGETLISATTVGFQNAPSVVALADGGWEVSWESSVGAVSDIYQRHFAADVAGTALGDTLVGTGWDETLIGYGGNDRLDGAGGDDIMIGGFGNDTYVVDSVTDMVQELPGQGTDTVLASLNFSLATFGSFGSIENLTLNGKGNISGTGNALANVITGNVGNNILDGGVDAVVDTLIGGAGNDTYVLGSGSDIVSDSAGIDTITSTSSRSLAGYATIENLTLSGTGNINGNALANVLTGNAGKNILDGGADTVVDTLVGGAGNDTYVLRSGSDIVSDSAGVDTITSTSSRSLAGYATIENLTLLGSSNSSGTGNSLGNTITANSGSNILSGDAGNDVLIGMSGADSLTGGADSDIFLFRALGDSSQLVAGQDTIFDFSHAEADKVSLSEIDANSTVAGDQAFVFKGAAAFSGASGELRVDKQASDTYVYVDNNGDKVADFGIHFDDAINFVASDFLL